MNEDTLARFWASIAERLAIADRRADRLEAGLETLARRLDRLELETGTQAGEVGTRDLRELLEAC